MNLVKLLANNWQPIAIIALVGTGLAVSHHQGYKSAFAKQQAVIDKMERDKAQALLLSAQNYARELELARAEAKKYEVKAHAVGMALAKKQAEVSRLKTETTLLEHAAEFGGYVAELENQNQAWRDWAGNHSRKVGN